MTKTAKKKSVKDTVEVLPPLVYSTTIGRAKFPEFVQLSYGEKAVIGFDRYGHVLGAIVPIEAVKLLAGRSQEIDPLVRSQIARSAANLLSQLPVATGLDGLAQGGQARAPRSILELEEIEARRKRRTGAASKARKSGR